MAMFENISEFFKRFMQNDKKELLAENPVSQSKDTAKDRLHVVLMQDRANVSADFLEMMKEEIIDVIKKYIVVDETKIDVRLTNEENEDGSIGVPLLHANIPILNIRNDLKGNYMNGVSSNDNIEGQQEINIEENNNRVSKDTSEKELEKSKVDDIQEKQESVEKPEIEEEIKDEEIKESDHQENEKSEDSSEVEIKTDVEELNDEIIIEEKIEMKTDSEDENLEDDDDDVTFDDLLKAAEEEEEKLKKIEKNKKQKQAKKESNSEKKSTPKKKKTSKKSKK